MIESQEVNNSNDYNLIVLKKIWNNAIEIKPI